MGRGMSKAGRGSGGAEKTSFIKARMSEGWNRKEAEQKWQDTQQMKKMNAKYRKNGPREITSGTYERAERRSQKNVNSWFGRGM